MCGFNTVKKVETLIIWHFLSAILLLIIILIAILFMIVFKGVLHPWPILRLFIHFSQKLQHTGDR